MRLTVASVLEKLKGRNLRDENTGKFVAKSPQRIAALIGVARRKKRSILDVINQRYATVSTQKKKTKKKPTKRRKKAARIKLALKTPKQKFSEGENSARVKKREFSDGSIQWEKTYYYIFDPSVHPDHGFPILRKWFPTVEKRAQQSLKRAAKSDRIPAMKFRYNLIIDSASGEIREFWAREVIELTANEFNFDEIEASWDREQYPTGNPNIDPEEQSPDFYFLRGMRLIFITIASK